MLLYTLPGGDIIERKNRSLIVSFHGKRLVLCTSPLNGGLTYHLKQVFNNDAKSPEDGFCRMLASDMAGHMSALARQIGLDPRFTAGLTTAADMDNAVIREIAYDNFTVTAMVTAGIDHNGGRAGDTAYWHEQAGETVPPPGTINIFLFINARLAEAAMLQALTTCAEAKCAALQELLAPSVYSDGIATGSGTDGTIIVADEQSDTLLTDAGKHYKLGEMIARVVIDALKEALHRQSALSAESQHNALQRMARFGVCPDDFAACPKAAALAADGQMLAMTSLYAHLIDQLNWGMLSAREAGEAAAALLASLAYPPPQPPENPAQMVELWRQMFAHLSAK